MTIDRRILGWLTFGRLRLAALPMTMMLLLASPAAAQTFPERGRAPVVDQADLLSPQQEAELTAKSEALEQQTGRQFVVATINSLEGRTIEDYGYQLGRHWGIGREQEDDGVILLVAPNEKQVRIETGYGARVFLPDILSGRIIRNEILPRFREGDMAGGIMDGAGAVLQQISLSPEQAQENVAQAQAEEAQARERPNFVPLILPAMIFLFVMLSMARRASGRRYRSRGRRGHRGRRGGMDAGDVAVILWGLSALSGGRRGGGWGGGGGFGGFGGGGGFGGFSGGGGSFGGGGASGGW